MQTSCTFAIRETGGQPDLAGVAVTPGRATAVPTSVCIRFHRARLISSSIRARLAIVACARRQDGFEPKWSLHDIFAQLRGEQDRATA